MPRSSPSQASDDRPRLRLIGSAEVPSLRLQLPSFQSAPPPDWIEATPEGIRLLSTGCGLIACCALDPAARESLKLSTSLEVVYRRNGGDRIFAAVPLLQAPIAS